MRARNIKPGFFSNCELSEVSFAARLLFVGLWCYADREGRFVWKPKQIKAVIFPYDNVNIDKLLAELMSLHFITSQKGVGYVENFNKHQHPHPHEAKSALPEKVELNQCHDMPLHYTASQADVMIIDSLIPDTMIPDSNKNPLSDSDESNRAKAEVVDEKFEQFWNAFNYKEGKEGAKRSWRKIKPMTTELFEHILAGARREASLRPALYAAGCTPKMAQGWLTDKRWEDEHKLIPLNRNQQRQIQTAIDSDAFVREAWQQSEGLVDI